MPDRPIRVGGGSRAALAAVEEFIAWLRDRGYAAATVEEKARFVAGLVRWIEARGIALADLDERRIAAALKGRRGKRSSNHRRALLHFLEHLRDRKIVAPCEVPADSSPAARLEERYVLYLRDERGLVPVTVVNYRGLVRRFLTERFGRRPTHLAKLSPRAVADFLLRHLRTMSPKRAQLMGSALRSFLRFAFLKAETEVDLSLAVPAVRRPRKAVVPRYVGPKDVERILDTCDLTSSVGRRDHTVLLLLARLGLRAGEVVKLELDDLRWRAGELVVRGKGAVHDRLPLPKDVGEALARHLRDRVPCTSRRVFLRLRAPCRGFASASAVSTIAKRAIDRSGLRPPVRGAHLLRHSLATNMVQRGATMAEIGQVLRHRSANSTEIYAKVDFDGLRGVALPWLGKGVAR
jgi:site-specific recombinase XerD